MFYYVKDAYDKLGRPVALVLVRNHDKSAVEEQPMRNFTIYQMEVARRLLPPGVETVTIIFDMKDFGIKNMDLAFVKFMVVALERYAFLAPSAAVYQRAALDTIRRALVASSSTMRRGSLTASGR